MYFQDLNNPEIIKKTKQLSQGKSGVYKITNLQNSKSYVGSAITKKATSNRLYARFRNHFFHHHKDFLLKRAIKKYGINSFSWEILEWTEIPSTRSRETWFIQNLLPEYNILLSAENSFGYSHTLETREKMKAGYSESRRQAVGLLNKGKKLSPEVRKKLSQAAFNRTAQQKQQHQKIMEEWNQKMFSKPTQILDGDTREILGRYSSLREACRAFQGNYRTFKRTVKSGKKIRCLNIYVEYSS
jgi:group I intron endonuclease|nr:Nad9 [Chlorella vulgaris]